MPICLPCDLKNSLCLLLLPGNSDIWKRWMRQIKSGFCVFLKKLLKDLRLKKKWTHSWKTGRKMNTEPIKACTKKIRTSKSIFSSNEHLMQWCSFSKQNTNINYSSQHISKITKNQLVLANEVIRKRKIFFYKCIKTKGRSEGMCWNKGCLWTNEGSSETSDDYNSTKMLISSH